MPKRSPSALLAHLTAPLEDAMWMPEPCLMCQGCGTPVPGPNLIAQYGRDDWRWGLRLVAGADTVQSFLVPEVVEHPNYVAEAWQDIERELIDRITYRDPCSVHGCDEKARTGWRVLGEVRLGNWMAARTKVQLCPGHGYELENELIIAGHMSLRWTT